jgi:predicted methyltransferase
MGDIEGKKILFLGDDDFTSVAVSKNGNAKELVVLDIDKRILTEIDNISAQYNLGIKTIEYDARKKLPSDFWNKYDIIFTDPPYTPEGISLFISRAINALNSTNQSSRIYLCYGNSDRAKERYLQIYSELISSGLMIRWIFDKFNKYNGAESIGSTSSLFICEITPKTRALVNGDYGKPIYTNN